MGKKLRGKCITQWTFIIKKRKFRTPTHISMHHQTYSHILKSSALAVSFTRINTCNQNGAELNLSKLATFASELARQSDISSPFQLKPISIQENQVVSLDALLFA